MLNHLVSFSTQGTYISGTLMEQMKSGSSCKPPRPVLHHSSLLVVREVLMSHLIASPINQLCSYGIPFMFFLPVLNEVQPGNSRTKPGRETAPHSPVASNCNLGGGKVKVLLAGSNFRFLNHQFGLSITPVIEHRFPRREGSKFFMSFHMSKFNRKKVLHDF